MALKDLLNLVDDKLEAVFHRKEPDAGAMRKKVADGIERTRTAFLATEPVRGRKWFKVANNVVAFSPTLPGGVPMKINGKDTLYIPSERFPDFLDKLGAAVEAGELDDALLATGETDEPTKAPTAPKAPRKQRAGWSEARRAAHAAKQAAKAA